MISLNNKVLKTLVVPLLAFATMGFFAVITVNIKSLNPLTEAVSNFSFTDIYYGILHQTAQPDSSKTVSIVDIYLYQGRGNFAKLLKDIESCQPKVICVDAVFEGERPDDMDGDMALMEVVEEYDNIVFSMKMEDVMVGDDGIWESGPTIHSFFTQYVPTKEAFCNMPRGNLYDAMKRTVPIVARVEDSLYHSMIVETVNLYAGRDLTGGSTSQVSINYTPMVFPTMKPDEVLKHPELIRDRIIYIGDMHDNNDMHWSPIGEKMAGVEVLAYGTETMLAKKEIHDVPTLLFLILTYVVVLVLLFLQDLQMTYTATSPNLFVRFILGSAYARSLITFAYSSVLLGISFLVFASCNVSLNWGWALSGMAFLATARNLYTAIHDYLKNRFNIE